MDDLKCPDNKTVPCNPTFQVDMIIPVVVLSLILNFKIIVVHRCR